MRMLVAGTKQAPTLVASRTALPPEGAIAPAARLSRFRGPCCWGGNAFKLPASRGFTLIELLIVVAIMAIATAGVSFSLRDSSATALERDAQRLAVLLESARAQSRMTGNPVRWQPTATGFAFDGLTGPAFPDRWLGEQVRAASVGMVLLGPEPVIGPQQIRLVSTLDPTRSLTLATDGVRPFSVLTDATAPPGAP